MSFEFLVQVSRKRKMLFSFKTVSNLNWEEEGRLRKGVEVQHRKANKPNIWTENQAVV